MIILIAIGESSGGLPTLARAAELAVASQAAVVVLHVRERHYARGVVWDEPAPGDAAERLPEAIVSAAVDFQADLIIVGRSPEWTLTRW